MPLYLVTRDVSDLTDEDIDAAGYRAFACAYNYHGLRWLTSYWARPEGRFFCIYEAEDEAQVRDHSERSRIPYDEVVEIQQVFPENFAGNTDAQIAANT